MADRRLLVIENDSNEPDFGGTFAIDPSNASGIALPTARIVQAVPPAGSIAGEVILNENTNTAFIWTGTAWAPLAPSSIITYPDETSLRQDNPADGAYAFALDSGNLFIRLNGKWKQAGLAVFQTEANVFTDNTAAPGQIAVSIDTRNMFIRSAGNAWQRINIALFADEAARLADTHSVDGTIGLDLDTKYLSVMDGGNWKDVSNRQYQDEASLLSDSPSDGVFGIAEDTGVVFSRIGGTWIRLNAPNISVGAALPTAHAAGDLHQLTNEPNQLNISDGTNWNPINGVPTGTILMWPTTTPPVGFQLCDGSAAATPALQTIVGNNVPDLRNQFIRGFSPGNNTILSNHDWTTGGPRNAFTGTTNQAGQHGHTLNMIATQNSNDFTRWDKVSAARKSGGASWVGTHSGPVVQNGNHTHTVTINGGGDPETAPVHTILAFIIRT